MGSISRRARGDYEFRKKRGDFWRFSLRGPRSKIAPLERLDVSVSEGLEVRLHLVAQRRGRSEGSVSVSEGLEVRLHLDARHAQRHRQLCFSLRGPRSKIAPAVGDESGRRHAVSVSEGLEVRLHQRAASTQTIAADSVSVSEGLEVRLHLGGCPEQWGADWCFSLRGPRSKIAPPPGAGWGQVLALFQSQRASK